MITRLRPVASRLTPGATAPASWPGIRTLRSRPFRLALAVALLLLTVSYLSLRLVWFAADPDGAYGSDFVAWYGAASDVRAGVSPYPPRYLEGPVAVMDFGYKYPPTFGQALLPLTMLNLATATHVWAAIQIVLAFAAVWLAGVLGGAKRTVEYALWAAVAAALWMPFFSSIHLGNVSAVQAFQVAVVLGGGALAGGALASAVLLKSTPMALVPAALLHGGRLRWSLLISGFSVAAISFVAAPHAWIDFARIQANLLAGPYTVNFNMQPASQAAWHFPDLPLLADVLRAATLAVAGVALVSSLAYARRRDGWPVAVTLAVTALLLIPGGTWYHYLAMLLPLAAFAWPRASQEQRLGLFGSAAAVVLGMAWLPLATAGAMFLTLVTLRSVAPRTASQAI